MPLSVVLRYARPARPITCFAVLFLLTAFPGCGTSEYNQLADSRASRLTAEAPFKILFGPTELADTPITIRVPTIFKEAYVEDSAHPEDGAKINADRVQPPFLTLPGFKTCYEGHVNDFNNNRVPFYCYLAAVPAKPGDAETLAGELLAQLKEKFKDAPMTWEDAQPDTPEGKPMPWKKIRVTGDQPFHVSATGKNEVMNMPGNFELWMHDAPDYIVLVAWRAPAAVDGLPPAPFVAQGQKAPPPPPIDRPNLQSMPALTAGSLTIGNAAAAAPGG